MDCNQGAKQEEVTVKRDVRIPMRDGITLSADIYRPRSNRSVPAIVMRTPYGKNGMEGHHRSLRWAARGYGVVTVDVRGRGDSDGVFTPYIHEGVDGYDTIEWVADQPWCDGRVGTTGGSYLGRIQWLTALEKPPHLQAMISMVTPSDPFVEWPTGVPTPHHLCWLYLTSGRVMQNVDLVDWERVYWHLPLVTMDEQTGRTVPHWKKELEHTQLDEWWRRIAYQERLDELELPVLHISGWYDDEQVGTPLNYMGMKKQGRNNQKLVMGPWPHQINRSHRLGDLDFGVSALIDLDESQLSWFDYWLKGNENGIMDEPPVSIFVMGDNRWRKEEDWPLPRTVWTPYYLDSGGRANSRFGDGMLTTRPPAAGSPVDRYRYDPAFPVPFITEMVSHQIGGPDDYRAIERRDDVLVYDTDILEEEIEVTGPIRVRLFAATSACDTDFTAKLLDVRTDGFAQRLTDGIVRARFRKGMDRPELVKPHQVLEYEIDCWNTSHVFKKGHRIRLEISSSAFPKYDRNLNTGAPLGQTTEMRVADQVIYHDADRPSALILPIIPR